MPSSRRPVSSIALLTGVLVLLCIPLSALPSTASPGVESPPTVKSETYPGRATYDWVANQDFASGSTLLSVGMPGPRKVMVQTWTIAGNHPVLLWDDPKPLYRPPAHVTCDAIEGRSGPYDQKAVDGGVALVVRCGRAAGDSSRSVALVTRDTRNWAKTRVDTAVPPAVSPSGEYAAWLTGRTGEYIEWSTTGGFSAPARTTYRFGSGGETLTVDDNGTVNVLGPERSGRKCVVGVHSRTLAGTATHSVVTGTDPGCATGRLENVDALTVTGGDTPETTFTISRATVSTPWRVSRIPAIDAPGLVKYRGSRERMIRNHYLVTGWDSRSVISAASPDRRHILVQRYDTTTQVWGPQAQVYDAGRKCQDTGFQPTEPREVLRP